MSNDWGLPPQGDPNQPPYTQDPQQGSWPIYDQPASGQPAYDQYAQPVSSQPAGQPSYNQPGYDQYGQLGYGDQYSQPGYGGQYGQPAYDPAYSQPQQMPQTQQMPPSYAPPPFLPPPALPPAGSAGKVMALLAAGLVVLIAICSAIAYLTLRDDGKKPGTTAAGKTSAVASSTPAAPTSVGASAPASHAASTAPTTATPPTAPPSPTATPPPVNTPGVALSSKVAANAISAIAAYRIDNGYMSDYCDNIEERLQVEIDEVYEMGVRATDFAEIRAACQVPATYNSTIDEYDASLAYVLLIEYGDGKADCSEICNADAKGRLALQKRFVDAAPRYSASYVTAESIAAAMDSACKGISPFR